MKLPIAPLNSQMLSDGISLSLIWRTWFSQLMEFLASLMVLQQTIVTSTYALTALDAGKQIYHAAAGAVTVTIPANGSISYPIGTQLFFINNSGAGVMSIAITSDTLLFSPSGGTGTRSLAASGFATATKITSTRWIIFGTGLT